MSELEERREELKRAIAAQEPKKIVEATVRVLMADKEKIEKLATWSHVAQQLWFDEGWRPIGSFTDEDLIAELRGRREVSTSKTEIRCEKCGCDHLRIMDIWVWMKMSTEDCGVHLELECPECHHVFEIERNR